MDVFDWTEPDVSRETVLEEVDVSRETVLEATDVSGDLEAKDVSRETDLEVTDVSRETDLEATDVSKEADLEARFPDGLSSLILSHKTKNHNGSLEKRSVPYTMDRLHNNNKME